MRLTRIVRRAAAGISIALGIALMVLVREGDIALLRSEFRRS